MLQLDNPWHFPGLCLFKTHCMGGRQAWCRIPVKAGAGKPLNGAPQGERWQSQGSHDLPAVPRAQEQLLELALDVVALPRMQSSWFSLITSCFTAFPVCAALDSGLLQTSFWLSISTGIKAPWLLPPMLLVPAAALGSWGPACCKQSLLVPLRPPSG